MAGAKQAEKKGKSNAGGRACPDGYTGLRIRLPNDVVALIPNETTVPTEAQVRAEMKRLANDDNLTSAEAQAALKRFGKGSTTILNDIIADLVEAQLTGKQPKLSATRAILASGTPAKRRGKAGAKA